MLGFFWTNFYTRSLPENRNSFLTQTQVEDVADHLTELVYTVQRGLELMLSGPMAFLALIFSLPDQFLMRRDLEKRRGAGDEGGGERAPKLNAVLTVVRRHAGRVNRGRLVCAQAEGGVEAGTVSNLLYRFFLFASCLAPDSRSSSFLPCHDIAWNSQFAAGGPPFSSCGWPTLFSSSI